MRKIKNKESKLKKLKSLPLWFVISVFVIFNVFFAIQTSASGAEVSYIESKRQKLIEENKRLEEEIAQLNSLRNIRDKASDLGFSDPQAIVYLTKEEVFAKAK